MLFNHLKLGFGCITDFDVKDMLPMKFVVFHIILTIDSDCFPERHQLTALCSVDDKENCNVTRSFTVVLFTKWYKSNENENGTSGHVERMVVDRCVQNIRWKIERRRRLWRRRC